MAVGFRLKKPVIRALGLTEMEKLNDRRILIAQLTQGLPWEELEVELKRIAGEQDITEWPSQAFVRYLLDGNIEDARRAALFGVEKANATVAGEDEELRRFFKKWGTDFTASVRYEMWNGYFKLQEKKYAAEPERYPNPNSFEFLPTVSREVPHLPFNRYRRWYEAHLSLELVLWLSEQDEATRHRVIEAAEEKSRWVWGYLPQIELTESWLREIGMDEARLVALRERVLGEPMSADSTRD